LRDFNLRQGACRIRHVALAEFLSEKPAGRHSTEFTVPYHSKIAQTPEDHHHMAKVAINKA